MKNLITLLTISFMISTVPTDAQVLKKVKKKVEKTAEETVYRKVEEKTAEKTEKALDSILTAPERKIRNKKSKKNSDGADEKEENGNEAVYVETNDSGNPADTGSIEIYSKFDFVPGDKIIFFDDFSNDYVGDFPGKWNTNGSGEIVTIGDDSKKWLELKPGYGIVYIPDLSSLPEEYTIEFDLIADGLDQKTGSTAVLKIGVSDDPSFKWGKYANIDIPFCQYHPVGFFARNGGAVNNKIDGDIRNKVLGQPHISIAVNKQRFRLWVDESKYVDIPRMIPDGAFPKNIKFELHQFKDGKERLFITNIKVAEGGQDLRGKLLSEGKISTTAILFHSGSANLQPQSMGVIRQISQALQQESSLNLKIVGHTDADGDDVLNLTLSKQRGETVKNVLITVYGIDESRLQTEGRGETEPFADNTTVNGKAQNRRVEFIKM